MVDIISNPEKDAMRIIYLHPGDVLGDWTVLDKIGEGGFGAVYSVLKAEYYVLTELKKAKAKHFCDILDSGLIGENKYVVMTLVGQSLTDLRKHDPTQKIQKFTMGCALSVGIKCLEAIEELHNIGYLHRDIKPGNFAIGRKIYDKFIYLTLVCVVNILTINYPYVIHEDLLASVALSGNTNFGFHQAVTFKDSNYFCRYASISTHISREQCRKDDLESWMYQQVCVGYLPWKNIQDKDEVGRCKQLCRTNEYIKELFGGCPREYITIMELIDSIRYYSKPEYSKITDLLRDALRNNDVSEYPYDWEKYLESSKNIGGTEGVLFSSSDKRPQDLLANKGVTQSDINNNWECVAVVLVMAAKRERAIKNHLNQLIKLRPSAVQFPIVISQDGDNQAVIEAISSFAKPPSDLDAISKNYFHIAHHYKWALDKIFFEMKYDTAIITEDDLDLADDFFRILRLQNQYCLLMKQFGVSVHGMIMEVLTSLIVNTEKSFTGQTFFQD
ncbi:Tau-tubulin kinase 2 [Dirofilaria immitis]|nr:Tau-tubulin kinase 2 [Dirofilaria immitis]